MKDLRHFLLIRCEYFFRAHLAPDHALGIKLRMIRGSQNDGKVRPESFSVAETRYS